MWVRPTRNVDKERGFVNGMGATVQSIRRDGRRDGLQVRNDEGEVVIVHPVTQDVELFNGQTRRVCTYPPQYGYSTTLHKEPH